MKVLLALPPGVHELEIYKVAGIRAPPLGLAYLASVLEREGHKVAILDSPTLRLTPSQFLQKVREYKPDVVGLSMLTPLAPKGYIAAKMVKELDPGIVVVAGGPHPTYMYEEALRSGIDVVVRYEGEKTFAELVAVLEKRGPDHGALKQVKGIAFKDRSGKVVVTPRRPFIARLDEIPPPARHLLPMSEYTLLGKNIRVAHVMASRGCPYGCIFCSTSYYWGRMPRFHSPQRVADEVEELVTKYKAEYLVFADDELTLSRKFVYDLINELKRRGVEIPFSCGARVDHVDREFMKFLLDNGCVALYLGVESGSQETLDRIGKRITLDQARRVFEWAKELKAFTMASFVIGFPWETVDDVRKTIEFALRLEPSYAQFTVATPYPGTPLYDYAEKHGLIVDRNWEHYTTVKPVMKGFYLSPERISALLKEAYRKFYLRWSFIRQELRSGRLLQLAPKLLREAFSFIADKVRGRI